MLRTLLLRAAVLGITVGCLSSCGEERQRFDTAGGDVDLGPGNGTGSCSVPGEGCACATEGQEVECGETQGQEGDYLTCRLGTRTCESGKWTSCYVTKTESRSIHAKALGLSTQGLGTGGKCPANFDKCDPYCNLITDTPDSTIPYDPEIFTVPPGGGLTIQATGVGACTSIDLTASTTTVEVSSLTSFPASPTFTLVALPAGCTTDTFDTTWAIDKLDRATVSGTTNKNGALNVLSPIAGTIRVTAFGAGSSDYVDITVKVNVLEAPTSSTTDYTPATSTQITAFGTRTSPLLGAAGTATATWLYPYENTYFPLALPAPAALYRYSVTGGSSGGAVKASLRYPVNCTATGAKFNYSLVVAEANKISQTASVAANTLDPQVKFSQTAWQAFERSARGDNADLILQRRRSDGTLEAEVRRPIRIVDGQLKGSVFYNSYTSPLANLKGAVLKIAPGETTPTVAVQPSGQCVVCHSINNDGSKLIANGSTNATMNSSRQYNIGTSYSNASPPVLNTYNKSTTSDTENVPGDRFTFGGARTDGSLYMTHGGSTGGDTNWRAPPAYSNLYSPNAPNTIVSLGNWPSNMLAVTPRFSKDGNKLAFGFWGGNTVPKASGTLASVAAGTRLVAMDFTCNSPPCGATSAGLKVQNAVDLTPGVTERVAWPTFTPTGDAVVYQRQYRSSRSLSDGGVLSSGWSPSHINTVAGALAELWMSPTSGTVTPTRLSALNGVGYLPKEPRVVAYDTSPLFTYATMTVSSRQMDQSGATGTLPTVILVGSATTADVRIDIVAGGARGTATFRYSTNAGSSWSSNLTTSSTAVALGSTGFTASFGTGTYNANSIYTALYQAIGVKGSPSGGPWDFTIKVITGGARGTATFKYSTDAGTTYSAATFTTGASVNLPDVSLTLTFPTSTYNTNATYSTYVYQYHQDNAEFTINQADGCSNTGTATDVYDYRLNYLPNMSPTQAGGVNWVVFTSRRMYGNVAADDPWDGEPGQTCNSGQPHAKKLWIAALDSTFTPGSDPSHPAFYLPGQELKAGNSDAYWVASACTVEDATCDTNDDCCSGLSCKVTDASSVPAVKKCQGTDGCSQANQACSSQADCCSGLTCLAALGTCILVPPQIYETQLYEREFLAECPFGTHPIWRYFEWQSTIPSGTKLDFSVQTKLDAGDDYTPMTAIPLGTATSTTAAGAWARSTKTVDALLVSKGLPSLPYLKVSVTFSPDTAGTSRPVLNNWRQIYDCVPAE